MNKVVEVLKAVSDPTRMRILMSLMNGELCVCRITALLDLAPSTISKHLSILRQAKFLKSRKDGKWIYFELNDSSQENLVTKTLELLRKNLENDSIIKTDAVKLGRILQKSREELCKNQKIK
ncbi:MAG TPA: ArsR family transcriptional regulator [Lentisphaeria bacterium]|nr:MAG: hypothetical protein A2X47_03240 [Lentisphaerae bacterium GWF2_38_69]HBM15303.1 ArsR family transcriptional regulator [Lentisphaeria bacterium]